jgi:RNA-directed DNA polymerase
MSTATMPVYEWKDLPWKRIEQQVFKLQKRIYQASGRGDVKTVHKLQRLLLSSWAARCLAVRKVTQDNRGKKTAGVDGVKSLTPPQRLQLVQTLHLSQRAKPTRRVWIAKQGTSEQRPLGIPTIHDRAEQALTKLALEPEWQAKFEPNSYGFRPGRSCHDAIEAIFGSIKQCAKYVLDADIAKCYDRINHQALLQKLHTFPKLGRAIRAWLQAGVLDGGTLFPTTEGVPQGGPLSPLLANVALHGLESAIVSAFPPRQPPTVVRYADDLVALHPDLRVIERVEQIAATWLAGMGLELKPSKTRITHTLQQHNAEVGFNFLGVAVRQYPVGKTHTGTTGHGVPLGFKTIIKPSKEAITRFSQKVATIIDKHRALPQYLLIEHLNPMIRGWTAYYATVASKRTFATLSHQLYLKLRRWAKRRHPKKPWYWVVRKYWHPETGKWDFGTPEGLSLYLPSKTRIRHHRKVKASRSPFDGDWVYWASRLGRHPGIPNWIATTLHRQTGKCAWCGLYLTMEDLRELDHRIPTSQGGARKRTNWQIIHGHCHDTKTAQDGSLIGTGAPDKRQPDRGAG